MDIAAIQASIKKVISKHKTAFQKLGANQSKLLELGSITGTAQHFMSLGYSVNVVNPSSKSEFIVKTSTQGFPWNFSHINVSSGASIFELHMNLMVESAHDTGIYCVDVGVAMPGIVPKSQQKTPWACLPNKDLLTFAEAKKLVVYPMLLAQFIGIVHEIKPDFLTNPATASSPMFPTLISLGHFSGNSANIVQKYAVRQFNIWIAENFDTRLSKVNLGLAASPFL